MISRNGEVGQVSYQINDDGTAVYHGTAKAPDGKKYPIKVKFHNFNCIDPMDLAVAYIMQYRIKLDGSLTFKAQLATGKREFDIEVEPRFFTAQTRKAGVPKIVTAEKAVSTIDSLEKDDFIKSTIALGFSQADSERAWKKRTERKQQS